MSTESVSIYGSLTALDREDVTRVLWTRTDEWVHASEVERLRNAIEGYVNARLAGRGSTAAYWWELQEIAKEKRQ